MTAARAAWLGLPRCNRCFREPDGQAAALAQRDVIGSPIRHSVPLLRDVMTAILVRFEWHGDCPGSGTGLSSYTVHSSPPKTDQDTILVIDDDAAVRDLMTRFLSKLDLNVVAARSGEEGLRLAAKLHPLIITLDVIMPGQDGWSVLNQLKADPELSEIPVIMVTIVDNEAMGINLGASNYLVKPVHRERLADLIEKYRAVRSANSKTIKIPVSLPSARREQEQSEAENPRRR